MASHYVAIARASLAAGLLRPDPTPLSRDTIAEFHRLLDEAISRCSPSNVQKCKDWLVQYIIPSTARVTALGKFLAALTTSFDNDNTASNDGTSLPPAAPSVQRKRLHILYLLNDVLHHIKYHRQTSSHSVFASGIQPQLLHLVTTASSFEPTKHPKLEARLNELLNLWKNNAYYDSAYTDKLFDAVSNARSSFDTVSATAENGNGKSNGNGGKLHAQKDAPFIMPSSHGDQSTPFYDLPAGNMLPHIVPNSVLPINSKLVKPLQFIPGPADESLASVVKDFLKDVASIYDSNDVEDEGIVVDIDELGQSLTKDEVSGEILAKEAYYGWSVEFCERMKKRKAGDVDDEIQNQRRGRSRSESRSLSPRKRRKHSSSLSDRGSRSPRGRRRNGRSPTRSRSRSRHSSRRRRRNSRSVSPPRPQRQSPPRHSNMSSFRQQPLPPPPLAHVQSIPPPPLTTPVDQIDNPIPRFAPPAPSQHTHHTHNFPLDANGLPIPPPPPFHSGPWPPSLPQSMPNPPPPPPSQGYNGSNHPNLRGFIPPPPPPSQSSSGSWQALGQAGGLASPMPLWQGGEGHVQNHGRGHQGSRDTERGQAQGTQQHRSGTGSYQQSLDPRRR